MKNEDLKEYGLIEKRVYLREGNTLYSSDPINTPEKAAKLIGKELLSLMPQEYVVVTNLDTRCRPISFHVASIGTCNASLLSAAEVYRTAIVEGNVGAILILHNHPSGDPSPSQADINITNKLRSAGEILGINVLDHVIVGSSVNGKEPEYYSFAEHGWDLPGWKKAETVQEVIEYTPKADRIKSITERLEQGIKDLFESDRYKEYLKTMAKFSNYSFNNTVLIALQRPETEAVAGYHDWTRKFDRHVKPGSQGIQIICPSPYKKKVQVPVTDMDGYALYDEDGKLLTKEVEKTVEGYKVGHVFAYEDTEGPELPSVVSPLQGTVPNYAEFMDVIKTISPVPIIFEPIHSRANGFYSLATRDIHVDESLSDTMKCKVCLHELAHALLHDKIDGEDPAANRFEREVCAESVGYTIMSNYGQDTSSYSFGYIGGWSENKELRELQSKMELIRKTANKIISAMDAEFLKRRMRECDELTFKNGIGYLYVQRSDNGYDFSFYDLNFNLVDGGQYDNLDVEMDVAIQDIMKSLQINPDTMQLQNSDAFQERLSATETQKEQEGETVDRKMKPTISHRH